jgi:hypothetical protein
MGDGLEVHGGIGGVTARLDDMVECARLLDHAAARLADAGLTVGAVAIHPDLLASQILAPVTGAEVLGRVAQASAGTQSLAGLAVRVEAVALALRAAVLAYTAADEAMAAAVEFGQDRVMFEVGLAALPLAFLGADAALMTGVTALVGLTAGNVVEEREELTDILGGLLTGDLSVEMAAARLAASGERIADETDKEFGDLVGDAGQWLTEFGGELVSDNPWITDVVAGGNEGLVAGLLPPVLGVVFAAAGGTTWPPRDYASGLSTIIGAGGMFGLLKDSPVSSDSGPPVFKDRQPPPRASDGAPAHLKNVNAVFKDIQDLKTGQIRIVKVPQPDGSLAWIVEIPGTQVWSAGADSKSPFDMTNNVQMMADKETHTTEAIRAAMLKAGIGPDDPVMLAGYSQGGIAAAALASEPQGFTITNVVTYGSPIADFDIPSSVHVLSIENMQDPVPRLDGKPNPDRPNWVTVRRDVSDAPGVATDPFLAHTGDPNPYLATTDKIDSSLNNSPDPSLAAIWRTMDPFLASEDPQSNWTPTLHRN